MSSIGGPIMVKDVTLPTNGTLQQDNGSLSQEEVIKNFNTTKSRFGF